MDSFYIVLFPKIVRIQGDSSLVYIFCMLEATIKIADHESDSRLKKKLTEKTTIGFVVSEFLFYFDLCTNKNTLVMNHPVYRFYARLF